MKLSEHINPDGNNRGAAPSPQFKLAALSDLLSEIAGRDIFASSWHHNRDVETRVESAAVLFGRIKEMLVGFENRREDDRLVWPPIWLPVLREDHAELAALYPDSTKEEIDDWVAVHFPKEEAWLRADFTLDRTGRLELRLAPLWFQVAVDCTGGMVTVAGGLNDEIAVPFTLFTNWLYGQASREFRAALADPVDYAQSLARRIPMTERFVRVERRELWDALPDLEHFIHDELTATEREEFRDVAGNLKKEAVRMREAISGFSAADYFQCCALCFDAVGLGDDDRGLSPRDRYRKHADGRHGGLLDLPEESSDAFLKWLASAERLGGHPWEICRGGNSTHISLSAMAEAGGVRLVLAGSATTRAAEAVKMALVLWSAGIPFILHDADLHLRRVDGEDWIGIFPDSYGLQGRYFFPSDIDITDCYPWGECAASEQLLAKVRPLPLEK